MFVYSILFMRNNDRILKQVKQTLPNLWMCPDPSHRARTRNGTRNRTMPIYNETHAPQPVATYDSRKKPGGGGEELVGQLCTDARKKDCKTYP